MNSLDLHGVKHADVGPLVDSFIWEHMKKKSSGIKIITGNSPEMRKIVTELAAEYGFTIVDCFGKTTEVLINLV
jgi:hypothetical protein